MFSQENNLQFLANFSLLGKMSDRLQQNKLRLKQIILEKNRKINELLEEAKSRNLSKARKEKINIDLVDLYEQLHVTEQALFLLG